MNTANVIELTPEDAAILARCPVRFEESQTLEGEGAGDAHDYREMLRTELTRREPISRGCYVGFRNERTLILARTIWPVRS